MNHRIDHWPRIVTVFLALLFAPLAWADTVKPEPVVGSPLAEQLLCSTIDLGQLPFLNTCDGRASSFGAIYNASELTARGSGADTKYTLLDDDNDGQDPLASARGDENHFDIAQDGNIWNWNCDPDGAGGCLRAQARGDATPLPGTGPELQAQDAGPDDAGGDLGQPPLPGDGTGPDENPFTIVTLTGIIDIELQDVQDGNTWSCDPDGAYCTSLVHGHNDQLSDPILIAPSVSLWLSA